MSPETGKDGVPKRLNELDRMEGLLRREACCARLEAPVRPFFVWSIGSIASTLVSGYAFLNFWAAADLGYDAYPEGKVIVERWGNITLVSLVVALGCGIMAFRHRRTRR